MKVEDKNFWLKFFTVLHLVHYGALLMILNSEYNSSLSCFWTLAGLLSTLEILSFLSLGYVLFDIFLDRAGGKAGLKQAAHSWWLNTPDLKNKWWMERGKETQQLAAIQDMLWYFGAIKAIQKP